MQTESAPSIARRFRLDGKVAVVTGASKGIGEAIAHGLAEFGAHVVVSSRKQEAVEEVAAAIRDGGYEATGLACHMGDADEIRAFVDRVVDEYGGIDIVVNNAAANPVYGPVEDTDEGAFDKIMDVNLRGPFELGKRALPSMQARGGGSIINISSIGGLNPEPGIGIYSVSKAAIINLTKVMAKEWGVHGVRANVICPGLVKTKFSKALWDNEAMMGMLETRLPLGRIGQPEEMAGAAVFLASDAASYCTGAVVLADGGFMLM
jgi:NAD(P)-dependent dehydrogenase (short-subunit alcohol dehydrogenase family)